MSPNDAKHVVWASFSHRYDSSTLVLKNISKTGKKCIKKTYQGLEMRLCFEPHLSSWCWYVEVVVAICCVPNFNMCSLNVVEKIKKYKKNIPNSRHICILSPLPMSSPSPALTLNPHCCHCCVLPVVHFVDYNLYMQ